MGKRYEEYLICDHCGSETRVVRDKYSFTVTSSDRYMPRRPDLPVSCSIVLQCEYDQDVNRDPKGIHPADTRKYGEHKGEFCSQSCAVAWLVGKTASVLKHDGGKQ